MVLVEQRLCDVDGCGAAATTVSARRAGVRWKVDLCDRHTAQVLSEPWQQVGAKARPPKPARPVKFRETRQTRLLDALVRFPNGEPPVVAG